MYKQINKHDNLKNWLLFNGCVLHPCSVLLYVYYALIFFYLTSCVCVCHSCHGPLRECLRARRFRVLPITAPPSVLVPAVPGTLAVWIRNQKKTMTGEFQRPWDHSIPEILPSLRACINLMRPNELWTCPDDGAARSQAPGCQRSSCGSVRRGRGGDRCSQQRN